MITVDTIIERSPGVYCVYVSTKRGNAYYLDWAGTEPTKEEVLEVWREDRKWFVHIN